MKVYGLPRIVETQVYCQSCNTTIFLAYGSSIRETTLHLELNLRRRAIRLTVEDGGKKGLPGLSVLLKEIYE